MVELVPSVKQLVKFYTAIKTYLMLNIQKKLSVGMVFQQPNPFPKSIYDNITYGPKTHGIKNKKY